MKCPPALFDNLFLFPTTSTSFYRYQRGGWKKMYRKVLSAKEKKRIMRALVDALLAVPFVPPKKIWGKMIEDRESQITFSALGQRAPVKAKEEWNKKNDMRVAWMKVIKKELPDFEVRSGGLTSIDVTRKGIDKAYGVQQIKKVLKISIKDMVFIGDALYPGGNDAAAKKTGVETLAVTDPRETITIIKKILKTQ
jgi:HAD superfamily hydrolase (TIGR01484 family)